MFIVRIGMWARAREQHVEAAQGLTGCRAPITSLLVA